MLTVMYSLTLSVRGASPGSGGSKRLLLPRIGSTRSESTGFLTN